MNATRTSSPAPIPTTRSNDATCLPGIWHAMPSVKSRPPTPRWRNTWVKRGKHLPRMILGKERSLHPPIPLPRRPKILSSSRTAHARPSKSEAIPKQFMRTKQFVPTKSHPDAPTTNLVIEGLAGLLTAPIDKLKTMMESFPEEETKSSEVDWRGIL
ncbi:hypothetical protein BDZ45DRAFT_806412 [Acephala macrosclerotiorum]|nr:hypothetical protein BDZ45DRAFT_806412 [Acephala macrosclerotiorum]